MKVFNARISINLILFAKNIDCGYTLRGGFNEYPQSMFEAKIRKNVYPCIPRFYYTEVGYEESYISQTSYPDEKVWPKGVYMSRTYYHDVFIEFPYNRTS